MDWVIPGFYITVLLAVPWFLLWGKRDKMFHVLAGLYMLLGVFLLISLLSYSPDARPYENWGGIVGHASAQGLVFSVGLITGLALVALSWATGVLHFAKKLQTGNLLRVFGLLGALFTLSIAFPAMGGQMQLGISHWLAGLIGWGRFLLLGAIFILLLWPYWWLFRPVRQWVQRLFSRMNIPRFRISLPKRKPKGAKTQDALESVDITRPEDRIQSEVQPKNRGWSTPEPVSARGREDQNPQEEAGEQEKTMDQRESPDLSVSQEGEKEDLAESDEQLLEPQEVLGSQWQEDELQSVDLDSYTGVSLSPQGLLELFNEPPGSTAEEDGDADARTIARLIEEKLSEFGVSGKVVGFRKGPVVTRYEYEPAPGIKLSKVVNLSEDLALRIKALSVRMVAPLPGKGLIGIEVPNPKRKVVYFKGLVSKREFLEAKTPLTFALGVDPGGEPRYESLARMPHLLIAGTTGSGKSVCINTLLSCFLMSYRHQKMRMILVDPKRVELSFYEGVPNLLMPVIKDRKQAGEALKKAVTWMEIRYRHFAKEGVRDIESHNKTAAQRGDEPIPYIVIIIDEFADLMITMGKEVEEPLARLAQMARAVGIHLVVATQRPSVDVITGMIKANFPVRIAFKVPSKVDSRTILDEMGAEKLLGKGDMLFIPPGSSEPLRLHGPFVSEEETQRLSSALIADYMGFRLREAFPELNRETVDQWVNWIIGRGLVSALTRTDEPGSQERLALITEHGMKITGMTQDQVESRLDEVISTYYIPIPEMEEAPVEDVSEETIEIGEDLDKLLPDAARLIVARGQGSATMLQRKLKVGFARAARIMDQLEELGIVEAAEGTKSRKPLVGPEELEAKLRALGL